MTHLFSKAAALAAAALLTGASAAAAPPAIDSEAKAASALYSAVNISFEAPYYHNLASEHVKRWANVALQSLNSATTPAALMASPTGVTVPCEVSGSLTARMAPRLPRILKFEWHDCHFDQYGWPHSLDGPGEIALLSDSFTPLKVGAIRLGNASTDLVQTREVVTYDQINHDTLLRNVRMVGVIPLVQYQAGGSSIPFAYVMNGFIDETNNLEFPGSSREPQTIGSRISLEAVTYAGSITYNETATVVDEDLYALLGEFTFLSRNGPPYGNATERFRFNNLRVRNVTDWDAFTRSQTLDGKVDYKWYETRAPGCMSGPFTFKTRVPLHGSLANWEQYDSGDLTINDKVRTKFYSAETVPAGLPAPTQGMLMRMQVPGVGTFNYDTSSVRVALRPIANCDG